MQEVFQECTDCFEPLTKEEIEMNGNRKNYYYPICISCLETYENRILDTVRKK